MKRKSAKEILAESFRELAENKSVDKITIKDITENCGYSSATFYRQFHDKYDLIAWEYSKSASDIMNRIDGKSYKWSKTLIDAAEYFDKEKKYLANLFTNTSGYDSFVRYMIEQNEEYLKNYIMKKNGDDTIDETTLIYINMYCNGTVSLVCNWVLDNFHITKEELADIFEKSLPEPLHQYLY